MRKTYVQLQEPTCTGLVLVLEGFRNLEIEFPAAGKGMENSSCLNVLEKLSWKISHASFRIHVFVVVYAMVCVQNIFLFPKILWFWKFEYLAIERFWKFNVTKGYEPWSTVHVYKFQMHDKVDFYNHNVD